MSTEIEQAKQPVAPRSEVPAEVIEKLVLHGDLSGMQPQEKTKYYNGICQSLGLNPLTQPFAITKLNGKEVMYARKDAAEQLRKIYGISITKLETSQVGEIYMVTVYGKNAAGREDVATGAISLQGKSGEALGNAIMKCETKAKRRLTLSICGLGMLDETEVESVQEVQVQQAKEENNYMNIDVVEPSPENLMKFREMLNAINNPIVPESLFGGQSKQDFINDFEHQLSSGTLPKEYADNVYNGIVACFPQQ